MGAFKSEYFLLRTAWMKFAQLSPRAPGVGVGPGCCSFPRKILKPSAVLR